jgi:restriction system protein
MANKMWMVRGEKGRLYDEFLTRAMVAIGWREFSGDARPGMSKRELTALYLRNSPSISRGTAISGAAQVWRFINEMQIGDSATTYSPANRTYLVGTISGGAAVNPEGLQEDLALVRAINWETREVERDSLSVAAKNSLGSTLTVFVVPSFAADELVTMARSSPQPEKKVLETAHPQSTFETAVDSTHDEEEEFLETPNALESAEDLARERVKDAVIRLNWEEMQELVAGILRAMGYRTQVSAVGSDRGRDIIASPDGFGFENPRIVVEVKHRNGQMGSGEVRKFLGGRHKDDRGLFVSTGGFTREARYEADRAAVPLMLWTLDDIVRTLYEYYETTDTKTKRLVPLKRVYFPA